MTRKLVLYHDDSAIVKASLPDGRVVALPCSANKNRAMRISKDGELYEDEDEDEQEYIPRSNEAYIIQRDNQLVLVEPKKECPKAKAKKEALKESKSVKYIDCLSLTEVG